MLRRGRRLVFCEVKAKGGPGFGDPLEMITAEKLRRLAQAGESWLATRPEAAGLEIAIRGGGAALRTATTTGPSGTLTLPRGTIPERASLVRTVSQDPGAPAVAGGGRNLRLTGAYLRQPKGVP